ncbi:sulfatase-like hydrolase/transferase [Planctomycetales bacterium ZRK34]|nr:sulfatase-like hydrolase/transferase [Planctomycetales bacterium ZRK34]
MKQLLTIFLLGVVLVPFTWRSAQSAEPARRLPNIVLVMADDQGWGDMGYYGHPRLKTPNFDRMAAEAIRFDHFYSAAPSCSPTRGSILTGRHPNRYGIFVPGLPINPKEISIAQEMKRAGYVTSHFGKWHVGSVFKGDNTNPSAFGFDEWYSSPNFYENDPLFSHNGTVVQTQGEGSMATVDAAIDFIKRQSQTDKPFMCFIWFGSPHSPYQGTDELRALYPNEPPKDKGGNIGWLCEITGMDHAFGKLRDSIREMGIRDNTILWYISDNGGTEKKSTGGRGKKGSLYEGGLRVPGLLEWPARYPGHRVIDVPCSTLDFYPTFLEIAGLKSQHTRPMDGMSLIPVLEGSMSARPQPMGFWVYGTPGHRMNSQEVLTTLKRGQDQGRDADDIDDKSFQKLREVWKNAGKHGQYPADLFAGKRGGTGAWTDWPWKLYRNKARRAKTITVELYNLAEDPLEEHDLAADHPDRVKTMEAAFEQWRASVVNSLNGEDY